MSKVAVVYWSGTGNTGAMANEVAEGAKAKGAEVTTLTASEFGSADLATYDAVAFKNFLCHSHSHYIINPPLSAKYILMVLCLKVLPFRLGQLFGTDTILIYLMLNLIYFTVYLYILQAGITYYSCICRNISPSIQVNT